MNKLNTLLLLISSLLCFQTQAHITSSEGVIQHFIIQNKKVDGYFYMFKNNDVYLENTNHEIVHYPISFFSKENQTHILNRYKKIEAENGQTYSIAPIVSAQHKNAILIFEILLALCLIYFIYHFRKSFSLQNKMKFVYPIVIVGVATLLISADKKYRSITDPLQVDNAFIPFKPNVYTHWDGTWFYIESKGIPTTHGMMVGISNHGWQQQVPIPQCYIGANAWQVPLNPAPAVAPVPVSPNHFTRGAIAIAVNGVPIFNPYTNTGVDALVDGQLDNYGGHCGRADDYHYHIAPLHLYGFTNDTLPIAYALDGYAVLGLKERDGTAMTALDTNHGHNYGGTYHYHGTTAFPYMIGNMVGQVTEDTTFQIIPQAHATPVRPSGTPLNGALITSCTPNTNGNGYIFVYTLNGQSDTINYFWNTTGTYTFNYITASGTTTNTYNKFAQCDVPNAIQNIDAIEKDIAIYPNPATDKLYILLKGDLVEKEIQSICMYTLMGQKVYNSNKFVPIISLQNLAKGNYIFTIQTGTNSFSKWINKN